MVNFLITPFCSDMGKDHSNTMSLGWISIGSNFSTLPGTDSFVVKLSETGKDLKKYQVTNWSDVATSELVPS